MSRHSKNNNASSVFTYAERQMLNYGTKEMKVGRESMRNFDACFLCLQQVRDPVCCQKGHMACKECMYNYILNQKKQISRNLKSIELAKEQIEEEDKARHLQSQQEAAEQFVKAQESLLHSSSSTSKSKSGSVTASFNNSKPNENSFWVPSKAPEAAKKPPSDLKSTQVMCPIHGKTKGDDHPLNAKKLIPIQFSLDPSKKPLCLSCSKNFNNSHDMAVIRGCGHVVCKPCSDKFVKTALACCVCDNKCKAKDIVVISSEGTGYASKGNVLIKKFDHAFKA